MVTGNTHFSLWYISSRDLSVTRFGYYHLPALEDHGRFVEYIKRWYCVTILFYLYPIPSLEAWNKY